MTHRITTPQRRARLVAQHHLSRTAADAIAAVAALAALHSSDPCTPHLALWARVAGYTTADLDHALCEERSLWRLHAMRRTLFVVTREAAPAVRAAASDDVAAKERRRLRKWLEAERPEAGVSAWLAEAEADVRGALADGLPQSTKALAAQVPALGREVTLGAGKWARRAPVGPRLLYVMAMEAQIVRTRPAGSWRSGQYGWADAEGWFGALPRPLEKGAASAALLTRYLEAYGPATTTDIRWWTGWTARQTHGALEAVGPASIRLDEGADAWILEDDREDRVPTAPKTALLPALDATPMGWKTRDWFLGDHATTLFDRNGNAGPTVWWDGRVVGGWAQTDTGEVVYRLLEDVGGEAEAAVAVEAGVLTAWLDGVVVKPRFRAPLERALSG